MRVAVFTLQDMLDAFRRRKVLTRQELILECGCSWMTAWRLLRGHGYFTSYNHNARYYTIQGIPDFDEHGLWTYRQIRFSRWGSLTKTVIGMVRESASGLSAEQLQQVLHVKNLKPLLTSFTHRRVLARTKEAGHFVYYPVQRQARARQQKQRRKEEEQAQADRALPSLEHIIALLVEIIRRPAGQLVQWRRRLARQGIRLTVSDIQRVLDRYQIEPKKGLLKF